MFNTFTFNPSTLRAAGSVGVDVTCEDVASVGAVNTTNIAVTHAGTSRTCSIIVIIFCRFGTILRIIFSICLRKHVKMTEFLQ